jgi:general secretion pathway protein N
MVTGGAKKIIVMWFVIALASIILSILFFLPASWLGVLLEKQTNGRLSLGDAQGSFWRGSAFIGVAADSKSPIHPLFPGRFSWKISPILMLGQIEMELSNNLVLSSPITISGNFAQWQLSPSSLLLPPERLESLGAPLNTIRPTGQLSLRWDRIDFTRREGGVHLEGKMQLDMNDMASGLSSIKPLGSYQLFFDWHNQTATMLLSTVRGPMMLEGTGALQQGQLQFSGKAFADTGQEEKLANLLNLLGRRRNDGGKQVVALEYK